MELLAPIGTVYQAGTLSGNPVAMRAGIATLNLAERADFYPDLEEKAESLFRPVQDHIAAQKLNVCVQRCGSMGTVFFGTTAVCGRGEEVLDAERYKRFFQYMLSRNIFIPPAQNEAWFLSSSHKISEIEYVNRTIVEFLSEEGV